jgi:hypothetical protein
MSPDQLVCNVFKNERPSFDRYRRPRALAGSRLGLVYGRSRWRWRRVAVDRRIGVLVRLCAGFRTPVVTRSPHARRPASEKRQGTKSRGSGAPVVPRALWGFSRGVRLGRVGRNCPPRWLCLPGEVWMTGGTRGAGAAEENWQCSCEPIELPAVSGGSAGREPAGMASVTGLADRW